MSSERTGRKIKFNFMGVLFVKETKMPKHYEKFLRVVSHIYLIDQFKDFTCYDLEFTYNANSSDQGVTFSNGQQYEKFRMIANDESDNSEIEVKISFKNNESNDKKKDEISEYRQAKTIKKNSIFEDYLKNVVNKTIAEFKNNITLLLFEEYLTNLQKTNISCDICKTQPLLGFVYQCFLCDKGKMICEKCSQEHNHPVLRLHDNREEIDKLPIVFEEYIKHVINKEKQKFQEQINQEIMNLSKYDANNSKEKTIHKEKCNGKGCSVNKIKGKLYRCVICPNTCFCEKCSDKHEHPMIVE